PPQHPAGGRAGQAEYPLRQVRRAEVHRSGPRQGPHGLSAAGRQPAGFGGRHAGARAPAGVGPQTARRLMDQLVEAGGSFSAWEAARVPTAAGDVWPNLVRLMQQLAGDPGVALPAQVHLALDFYVPLLEVRYDNVEPRKRDLEQLEHLAARFANRQTMLAEIALDPPASSEDLAGPPTLDEDYLVLSTIHSAKGRSEEH